MEEEKLVIKKYRFTFTYPADKLSKAGALAYPVFKTAEYGINRAFEKTKKLSAGEDLPPPVKMVLTGLVRIDFYMANVFLDDIDIEAEMRRKMVKDRRLAPYLKKAMNASAFGLGYKFEELEEWKGNA